MKKSLSRRQFTKTAAASIAAPFILPKLGFGASHAAQKPNLAWVGLGGQGIGNLSNFIGSCNVVGLCDVDLRNDPSRTPIRIKGKPVNFIYGCKQLYPGAKIYQDFRKMFLEIGDKIDAVGIATHDSSHFAVAHMAMSMGKHVFIQKPLAHSVTELRTLQGLTNQNNLITQMGNQGHSFEGARLIKEWYQAGLIGDVEEVICWTNRPEKGFGFKGLTSTSFPPKVKVPEGLDWDAWKGPVDKEVGYSDDLHPFTWRAWWDFGCGGLGDIGCHTIDTPYWALDLGYPTRVDVEVERTDPLVTPNGSIVSYEFPKRGSQPPVRLRWFEGPTVPIKPQMLGEQEMPADGMIMIGSKGAIYHPGMRPNSPQLLPDSKWQEYRKNPSKRVPKSIPRVEGIFADWVNGLNTGEQPCSNFNYAAPLTEGIVLGTLAIRTGQSVVWDPKKMNITNNNSEASKLIDVKARKGWRAEDLTADTAGKFVKG